MVFSSAGEVLERYIFDISRFPIVGEKEKWTEFEEGRGMERVDVEEQLRATVKRLQGVGERMGELEQGCTFTVVVEVREGREAPIGNPMPWVASEPGLQVGSGSGSGRVGRDRGGVRSTPVRLVEAGEFVMECWVEEGRAKFEGEEG